jgi:hypothetical protein
VRCVHLDLADFLVIAGGMDMNGKHRRATKTVM